MSVEIEASVSAAARKDIQELADRIEAFEQGQVPEEKFRQFRLTRGIYGQRQADVQMIRIKLPFGRLTSAQLDVIADCAATYGSGNLHCTTRQDIQLHYVKLADTPQLWADLERESVTLREACGNTVRNVTASDTTGIDPNEVFDVAPYAHALAQYFLRNPICQEMGRKIKIAFSHSEADTALTFFHDIGFVARVRTGADGHEQRGFKVVVGGGLGAQPIMAKTVTEFMPEEEIIPFAEAVLRVFDRHGERQRRNKARIKFLIHQLGLPRFLELVEAEKKAVRQAVHWVPRDTVPVGNPPAETAPAEAPADPARYARWCQTNTFEQKQAGYHGVYIKLTTGDLSADLAQQLAALVRRYAADDLRVTVGQGLLLRFVPTAALPFWFNRLDELGLAASGYGTLADITACPGTDTCNLGIASSMGLARVLETMVVQEYPEFLYESDIQIKISGCMNSCGQHEAATIGLHGSSIRVGGAVVPAMLVCLGGGVGSNGQGYIADKLSKVPTKRVPQTLKALIEDYLRHRNTDETYLEYYYRQGKAYFYPILKPFADSSSLAPEEYLDWEREAAFAVEVGVGECAGAMFDLVALVFAEARAKLRTASELLTEGHPADALYYAYAAGVAAAKGGLLALGVECNTQIGILTDFQAKIVATGLLANPDGTDWKAAVLAISEHEPETTFAAEYIRQMSRLVDLTEAARTAERLQTA